MGGLRRMWTSLEVAKLLVSALTPIVIVFLTLAITRMTKRTEAAEARAAARAENAEWANRRAVDRLIELHKEMAPLLNDLLCFFTWVGHFRDIDPPNVLVTKRQVDKIYFVNEHLFDESFRSAYQSFMTECFLHWQGVGTNAKLKTSKGLLKKERGLGAGANPWEEVWDSYFQEPVDPRETSQLQHQRYEQAMEAFASQLGLKRSDNDVAVGS